MKSYYFCLGLILTVICTGIQAEDADADDVPTEVSALVIKMPLIKYFSNIFLLPLCRLQ